MPLDLGPVQFQIIGTFMDKPRLLLNGEEVPYETLSASYMPAETFEYEDDCEKKSDTYPEFIHLSFSLSSQIGQLEANVSYRVKANTNEQFLLERVPEGDDVHAAKKPPFPPKKKDDKSGDEESPKEDKEKKGGKPDFKKKGKSMTIKAKVGLALDPLAITPDAGTRMYKRNLNQNIASAIVEQNNE